MDAPSNPIEEASRRYEEWRQRRGFASAEDAANAAGVVIESLWQALAAMQAALDVARQRARLDHQLPDAQ